MQPQATIVPTPASKLAYAGWAVAAAALLLLASLAYEVVRGTSIGFDGWVRDTVHSWASPPLTRITRGVTLLGSPDFLIAMNALVIARLAWLGRRRAAVMMAVASLGALVLNELLKILFHRTRPEAFFGYVEPMGYSFPSGHSISSACFYGVAAAIFTARMPSRGRKILVWAVASTLAGLIGFSRIYLGVHYPSDVLGGYAAAIVWVAAVRAAYGLWLRFSSSNRRAAYAG